MSELQAEDRVMLAGEYVLGVMTDAEKSDFETRMAQDAALATEVQFWTEQLSAMSRKLPLQPVRPVVWDNIRRSVATERAPAKVADGGAFGWFWKGWSFAASAAAVVLAVQLLGVQSANTGPRFVAVMNSPDHKTEWLVEATPKGTVKVYPIGQLSLPDNASLDGKALQLWTKAPQDAGPTSLGLMELGKPMELPASALPRLVEEQLFEVSLEPHTGSPYKDKPTGPVVLIGKTVALN
ncbi:anti-sigma factor [Limnobacter humi]|uniref:Anti-sigma factor n=1 Tax=Limnobacter humi TaxID=1778671 RepID=A0ABT1WD98_9BURK|nr:anti-sigma factor [Limnobacter humi]MCQ8895496.1 anti-sigma factor [Limnobacter humi]